MLALGATAIRDENLCPLRCKMFDLKIQIHGSWETWKSPGNGKNLKFRGNLGGPLMLFNLFSRFRTYFNLGHSFFKFTFLLFFESQHVNNTVHVIVEYTADAAVSARAFIQQGCHFRFITGMVPAMSRSMKRSHVFVSFVSVCGYE